MWQDTSGQAAVWELSGTNVIGGGAVGGNPGRAGISSPDRIFPRGVTVAAALDDPWLDDPPPGRAICPRRATAARSWATASRTILSPECQQSNRCLGNERRQRDWPGMSEMHPAKMLPAEVLAAAAKNLLDLGRLDLARHVSGLASAENAQCANAHSVLGVVHDALAEWQDGLEHSRRAVELQPGSAH